MTTVFADTVFYVAALNPRDALHSAATALAARGGMRVVTTEFVLVEVANFFAGLPNRPVFVQFLADVRADPNTEIVAASAALFARGADLFAARLDKEWSLTDCISFQVMQDRGLTEALTTDHHFTQAGFLILMK